MAGYIQTILNAFTSLDIEKLRLHLKDEYSYNETTKAIFLDALGKVFNQFKNAGNTELIIYEGKCTGSNCPNCRTKGYRFVGKRLMNYMDFLFEIDGDDIKDITECGIFTTDVEIENLGIRSEIEIRLDDKLTFDKTHEYYAKVNAAAEAWDEMITSPPQMLDFQDLSYWVDKHSVAYQLIGEDWYKSATVFESNKKLYSKHLRTAKEVLFQDIPEEVVVVEFVNENKNILNFVKNKDKHGFFNYSGYFEKPEIGDVLKVRFNEDKQNGFLKLLTAKQAESPVESEAIKNFEGDIKVIAPQNFGFSKDVFIDPRLIQDKNLENGQVIRGEAILSFNKRKNEWG